MRQAAQETLTQRLRKLLPIGCTYGMSCIRWSCLHAYLLPAAPRCLPFPCRVSGDAASASPVELKARPADSAFVLGAAASTSQCIARPAAARRSAASRTGSKARRADRQAQEQQGKSLQAAHSIAGGICVLCVPVAMQGLCSCAVGDAPMLCWLALWQHHSTQLVALAVLLMPSCICTCSGYKC
jgi:hypothetical protein